MINALIIEMDHPNDTQQMLPVIIAIDVGSSSIRCTAYDCSTDAVTTATGSNTTSCASPHPVQPLPSYTILASYSYPRKSIEPYTGHINIVDNTSGSLSSSLSTADSSNATTTVVSSNNLFDCIDICVDQVLDQLQMDANDTMNNNYNIIGVGFTTFVMNLIGIDRNGQTMGNDVTMSYACQTQQVQEEVLQLQR